MSFTFSLPFFFAIIFVFILDLLWLVFLRPIRILSNAYLFQFRLTYMCADFAHPSAMGRNIRFDLIQNRSNRVAFLITNTTSFMRSKRRRITICCSVFPTRIYIQNLHILAKQNISSLGGALSASFLKVQSCVMQEQMKGSDQKVVPTTFW
jgi:hypothetical protein